jgi:hypothetical protein
MAKAEWARVTRRQPCVICGKGRYCTRTTDGTLAKCMWIGSDWPDKSEHGGWIHKITGDLVEYKAPPPVDKKPPEEWDQLAKQHFNCQEAKITRYTLAAQLGVTYGSLWELRVGYGFDHYRGYHFSTWPQFDHLRRVTGIVRRYQVTVSDGGGNKLYMPGGRPGLHYARNGSRRGFGPLCLVEGGSDTAALLSIGVPVIGRPSSLGGADMIEVILRKILSVTRQEQEIIVIGEDDRKPEKVGKAPHCKIGCIGCSWCFPGRYGAVSLVTKLRRRFPNRDIGWAMAPGGYKDSRAWVQGNIGASARDYTCGLRKQSKIETGVG